VSDNEQWVRATPELKAATEAFLGTFPPAWREKVTCAACNGACRGYRNAAGEFAPEPLPILAHHGVDTDALTAAGFEWWFCDACHAHGHHTHPAVPAHTPAGKHILASTP
jgi:hypothetical protein